MVEGGRRETVGELVVIADVMDGVEGVNGVGVVILVLDVYKTRL